MAYSSARNNGSLRQGTQGPRHSHSFVPIESLSSSPRSSAGSASVLDWNSNSDGDVFHLSPPTRAAGIPSQQLQSSSRIGPVIYDFSSIPSSPSSLGISTVDDHHEATSQSQDIRRGTVTALSNDPFLTQWEITSTSPPPPDPFTGLMPPAPVSDEVAGAVAIAMADSTTVEEETDAPVDSYQNPLSAHVERLSLEDMVHEWNAAVQQEQNERVGAVL